MNGVSYRLLAAQIGILFAVQLPQRLLIALVDSSNIVVECDMQMFSPHSEQVVTACPLQTPHLANLLLSILPNRTALCPRASRLSEGPQTRRLLTVLSRDFGEGVLVNKRSAIRLEVSHRP